MPQIRRSRFAPLALLLIVVAVVSNARPAIATPIVVETKPLTPEEQRAKFHLPEGFEIQLVASESDIGQPMNMNFDCQGRLWVTHSLEYPFPAQGEGVQPRDMREDQISEHPPRDRLSYFEGIGPDGRATKVIHFAQGLNIPIGQYPIPCGTDGTAALVYSIPNISLFRDTNGDGVADDRQVLFTGFGNVDAHGMCNSFTRGFDGWIYACHGFRNTSKIALPGGGELVLNSGNTIRFRPDGSAMEQFTWGQVNPFGMAFDPWGDLYNADCHSYPITLLLRGAYYESFGKPHDGLGYGPVMINHNHGSTGICGVAIYDATQFPEDYRNCIYICNPVNGQVHRDKTIWTGSSPMADTQPEFITCDDGWFRPVDVKLGPDGALYIADFYNSIIGHYEAPLQHPLRDREKGRIWRVVYTGGKKTPAATANESVLPKLAEESTGQLIARLADANMTIRMLAMQCLVDRVTPVIADDHANAHPADAEAVAAVLEKLDKATSSPHAIEPAILRRVHAAWAADRIRRAHGESTVERIEPLAKDESPLVRTHAARILGEHQSGEAGLAPLLLSLLKDSNARVQRASAEALARHPADDQIQPLLDALDAADPKDTHLVHAIRISLRDNLSAASKAAEQFASWGPKRERTLADVALAVHPASPELAGWLRDLLNRTWSDASVTPEVRRAWLKQSARYSNGDDLAKLIAETRAAAGDSVANQVVLIRAITEGRQTAGQAIPEGLTEWADATALDLLAEESKRESGWTYRPLPGQPIAGNPFTVQSRPSQDGVTANYFCTLPSGEQRTGIYRSAAFEIPKEISFWMAGHDGMPPEPVGHKNVVRLLDAETGETLQEAIPPRNDMAQLFHWDCDHAGRRGVLEIVDADTGGAYAWLAVGRFSIPQLDPDQVAPGEAAVALIRDLQLSGLTPRLKEIAKDQNSGAARMKAARALVMLHPDARSAAALAWITAAPVEIGALRENVFEAIADDEPNRIETVLREIVNRAPSESHKQIADLLASDPSGAELLLKLTEEGRLSPRLLQQQPLMVRLQALKLENLDQRIEALTQSLPPLNEQINQTIAERRQNFDSQTASIERGHTAFVKRCAACHQVGTEGNKVGPQLDGIGVRGLDRLLEDILDPNRNVDAAFRSSTVALTDGRIVTGLKRREEGDAVIFADQEGKEFRVPHDEIDEMKLSPLSLMPANLVDVVPTEEFNDLLAWLLAQKQTPATKPAI